jgi:hypothetical protein
MRLVIMKEEKGDGQLMQSSSESEAGTVDGESHRAAEAGGRDRRLRKREGRSVVIGGAEAQRGGERMGGPELTLRCRDLWLGAAVQEANEEGRKEAGGE